MIPAHWRWRGPRRANVAALLTSRNVPGAHIAAGWRLIRIGPWLLMAFRYRAGELDTPSALDRIRQQRDEARTERDHLDAELEKLAGFILHNVPGEPSTSEGAVDVAIRIINATAAVTGRLTHELAQARTLIDILRAEQPDGSEYHAATIAVAELLGANRKDLREMAATERVASTAIEAAWDLHHAARQPATPEADRLHAEAWAAGPNG